MRPSSSAAARLLALVGVSWLAAACSLLTSLDGYVGADPFSPESGPGADARADSRDDSAQSSGGPVDGASPPTDAPPDSAQTLELHPNGTFETSLAPWAAYYATTTRDSTTAHGGSASARVCTTPSPPGNIFGIEDLGPIVPVKGTVYHVSLWFRAAPGAAAPSVGVLLRTVRPQPFMEIEKVVSSIVQSSAAWQKVELVLPVTVDAPALMISVVGNPSITNGCFLLDDVSVHAE